MDVKFKHLCHKISDMALGFKPFDGFIGISDNTYFGICFYEPRKPKVVHLIDVVDLKNEIQNSKIIKGARKSLTEARAKELSELSIKL